MKLFADTPLRRTMQVVADVLFVVWLVLWVWIGTAVHDGTEQLAGPRPADRLRGDVDGRAAARRRRPARGGTARR